VLTGVILDPSVALTQDALAWLEDPELRPSLVISAALWERMLDPEADDEFRAFDVIRDPDLIRRLRAALESVPRFSYRDVPELPDEARAVRDALLSSDEPLNEVLADEWVFLQTQSLAALRDGVRRTMEAFVRAGARIYEATNAAMTRALGELQDRLPPGLVRVMKGAAGPKDPIPKALLAGGEIALGFVPFLGVPVAIIGAIQVGSGLIAGDP
jgi:hypothetical protein